MKELWAGDVDYHKFVNVDSKLFFEVKDYFGFEFQRVHGTGMTDEADYALLDETRESIIGYEASCGHGGWYLDQSIIDRPRPPKATMPEPDSLIAKFIGQAFDESFKQESIRQTIEIESKPCIKIQEPLSYHPTKGKPKK